MRSRLRVGVLAATAAGALALTAAPASAVTTPWQRPPSLGFTHCELGKSHAAFPEVKLSRCVTSGGGSVRAVVEVFNRSGSPVTVSAQVRTAWGSNADCAVATFAPGAGHSCPGAVVDHDPSPKPLPRGTFTVNGITDHY
ncbi:hypothetical protein [Streptomyces sp. NPDC048057]|uniref:hypothetical protein n=1 Tax=Streptomyces sp. NPDC048057 TaxID=3155628 RepID=UPI0033CB6455